MVYDYNLLPHKGIQLLSPYIPGKSVEEVAKEYGISDIIKLASNENPLGSSPKVYASLQQMHNFSQYPVSNHHPLREKLSLKHGLDINMVTISNGSDAIFSLLLTAFALHLNKHILIHDYAFSAYAIQAYTLGIEVKSIALKPKWQVDLNAMINACNEKTAIIFLANPNNPTGVLINHADIVNFLNQIPLSTIVVLDEAYHEYAQDLYKGNTVALLAKHPNLVITRTFSKAYGLASLRIGYALSNPQISAILYKIQLPFAVNGFGLNAAYYALDDEEFISKSIEVNKSGLKQMQIALDKLGLGYLPSTANFITVDLKQDSTPIFKLMQQNGVIVRPLHPYNLPNHLRVTIGTDVQNRRFLDILSNYFKKDKEHE